jgi:hypothetical protein
MEKSRKVLPEAKICKQHLILTKQIAKIFTWQAIVRGGWDHQKGLQNIQYRYARLLFTIEVLYSLKYHT